MRHQDSEKNKRLHETIESLAHPDEQAREHRCDNSDCWLDVTNEDCLNALLAKVRLAEAEWWAERLSSKRRDKWLWGFKEVERERIAGLCQAAGERAK